MRSSIFINGNSFFHKLDPRTKMFWLLVMFFLTTLWSDPIFLGAGLLISIVIAILLAKLPTKSIMMTLKFASLLIIMSLLIWPLMYEGKLAVTLVPIINKTIYREGIIFGAAMGLRISWMVVVAFIFVATTDQRDQVLGMVKLGLPYSIGLAFAIAFRYVPTIISNLEMIKDAQKARCFDFSKGSFIDRIKRHVPIMLPLFITSVRSATDLALALETRGYGAGYKRTSVRQLKFSIIDRVVSIFVIGIAVIFLILMILFNIGSFSM